MTDYKQLCADLVDALIAHGQPDHAAVGYVEGLLTRARAALAQPESQVPKNCWLDDEPGLYPSPCVFDDPDDRIDNCVCAQQLRAAGEAKTQCKYYRQCDQLDPQSLQGKTTND